MFFGFVAFASLCQTTEAASTFYTDRVDGIHTPGTIDELKALVSAAGTQHKKIAIVGAGKSQGGQTYTPNDSDYRISLSKLNYLVLLDVQQKMVTVQAGMTWAQLQKYIAPHKLSVSCMQSYNDFSIGGSLGVNVHGQDFHHGPLISTVHEFKLLQADGTIVTVNRLKNSELFGLAIGGYGLFGIIVEVTLSLVDDILLEKSTIQIDADDLADYFLKNIKDHKEIEFYSARFSIGSSDLLEKAFVISYQQSGNTNQDLFNYGPNGFQDQMLNKYSAKTVSLLTKSSMLRRCRFSLEKLMLKKKITMSRNNFMSYSLDSLPQDTKNVQYILQEYFIPYDQLSSFIKKMKMIMEKHEVNILNLTARHIEKNTESVLSFSDQDACALVLYLPVKKSEKAYQETVRWTQELIDAALVCKGTYYLPYQLIATQAQLEKAYPSFKGFVALKKMYDPQELFVNAFYQKYAQQ